MRLVSQDLKYDIPYEHVVLHTTEEIDKEKGSTEYFIFARTLDEKKFWTLAVYHTEKARMEALRSLHIARVSDRCYYRFPSES